MEDRCPICWENMTPHNSFCIKSCNHTFHGFCLFTWLRFKDPRGPHLEKCTTKSLEAPCPMCRKIIHIKTSKLRKFPHPKTKYIHKQNSFLQFFCCGKNIINN